MVEIPMILPFKKDVNAPLVTENPVTLMMQGDANAQTIRIEMTDKGQPASLEGYEADGYLIREDGHKVMCRGAIEGNVVTVPLNEHCYTVPGAYAAYVRIKTPDAQTRRTILRIVGYVIDEGNGPLVDTENVVPNLDQLLVMLERMDEARGEAMKWAEATVEAETLAPGSEATAHAEESETGRVTITYGIPAGVPGAEYMQIPFTARAGFWIGQTDGTYVQEIGVPNMPDAPGELHLDASRIAAADAQKLLDAMLLIWKAETYAGGVRLEALGEPMRDLPLLAGVYKWAV